MLKFLIPYLIVINLIGYRSMRTDKYKAVTHSRRTPEGRLFLYAALGGSVGSLWGMHMYRHKTKHASFVLGLPAILLLQVLLVTAGWILWH
jgi:uncharacterized membrane protein YsdA (DUF1294 family)